VRGLTKIKGVIAYLSLILIIVLVLGGGEGVDILFRFGTDGSQGISVVQTARQLQELGGIYKA